VRSIFAAEGDTRNHRLAPVGGFRFAAKAMIWLTRLLMARCLRSPPSKQCLPASQMPTQIDLIE
jgi:hypothetical protein